MGKALSGKLSCPCDRSCFYLLTELRSANATWHYGNMFYKRFEIKKKKNSSSQQSQAILKVLTAVCCGRLDAHYGT